MLTTALYILSAVVLVLAAHLLRLMIIHRKSAKQNYVPILWAHNKIQTAIEGIMSNDEDSILAGLQILAVMHISDPNIKLIQRLLELSTSANPLISRQASVTIRKLGNAA
jgi:hypothetical protein